MQGWFEPRKRGVFVDIGVLIGKYALRAAKVVGNEGMVVVIEPKIVIEVFSKNVDKVKRFLKKHGYDLIQIARMHISSFEWCVYFICIPLFS